jgi:uncharacterized protein
MSSFQCSICGKEFRAEDSPAMPFCSKRCRLLDLGRWLDERYGLEAGPKDDDDGEGEPRMDADENE